MTSVFAARRRAEEFATAVDGGDGGSLTAEVAELLGVVSALREHDQVAPRPEFVQDLRARLMAEAESALDPETAGLALPVRPRGARERRLVAAASAVVLIGGTSTVAAAAQSALPGDTLYPIKRGIERAEAELSVTSAGKGYELLDQARDRLTEVRALLDTDEVANDAQVPGTLEEFTAQAREGSDLLMRSFRETRDPDRIETVRTFASDGIAALHRIAEEVPAEAQDELTTAAVTLRDIDQEAVNLCATCAGSAPTLELPEIFLVRAEAHRALQNVSLREVVLDNSHPVVVPKGIRSGGTPTEQGSSEPQHKASTAPSSTDGPLVVDEDPVTPPDTPGENDEDGSGSLVPDVDAVLPGEQDGDGDEKKDKRTEHGVTLTDGLGGAVETLLPETGDVLD